MLMYKMKGRKTRTGAGWGYWAGVVVLFTSLGAAAGGLSLPPAKTTPLPPPPLTIGNQPVDLSQPARVEARRLARRFAQEEINLVSEGFQKSFTRERLGLRFEQGETERLIAAWQTPSSPLRRYRARHHAAGPAALPAPVHLDQSVALATLGEVKEAFDIEPLEARIDVEKRRVLAERVGRRLDLYATAALVRWSARANAQEVPLQALPALPRLGEDALRDIDFEHEIGWFATPYSRLEDQEHRTHNLKLAARALHGQVILPGQRLSFNDTVGERSEARGYLIAPVIESGRVTNGMGGGTCQVAGTLHAAAFFAGLTIAERSPHSRPSSYIRLGLDAVVSFPNKDLIIENPFDFGVVVTMTVRRGKVRAAILGPPRQLKVSYLRTLLRITPPPRITVDDGSLPLGVERVRQRGVSGYRVRRRRVVQQGRHQWREETVDTYPPTPQVVRVGTNQALAPPEQGAAGTEPFPHPCDMRMTQGPGDFFEEQTACE
jgi:vancomycin resistance protein YoaR